MKEMIKRVREERGGFTLAELLIVVAIILVLVAIAVPVFSSALNNANNAVERAQIRSVTAAASTAILTQDIPSASGVWKADGTVASDGSMKLTNVESVTAAEGSKATENADGSWTVEAYITETDLDFSTP